MAQVRIGTSGWSYGHWREVFYPRGLGQGRWLEHYAGEFDTVELNATFYRLPAEATFRGWRERTPEGFLFAVKAPRAMTHVKKLAKCVEEISGFASRVRLLGPRLGPALVQLPPRWPCDAGVLAGFLGAVPRELRVAFEFRDGSWLCEGIYALLREHNAALVRVSGPRPASRPAGRFPDAEVTTADFQYLRMHGEKRLYSSQYSDESLCRWAEAVVGWALGGQEVFVYFNNDAHGYAIQDARRLREMVRERC